MRWWHQFLFRLERIVHWREADQDLEEEIRSHIEIETQDNIDRGMSPEEAMRAARIKFGGVDLAKEDSRAVWGFPWAEQLWQDLRYGARILAKSPGFTATAVGSLALGIGATTAVFSVLDTAFLRPLPYPDPDRLVSICEKRLDNPDTEAWEPVSGPTFMDWKKQAQSFEEIAGATWNNSVLYGNERAEEIPVQYVSEEFFHMLGAHACQGRLFVPYDYAPGQPSRAILSYPAWQRLFGSDPSIVGKTIRLGETLLQVIGVMSPDYRLLWEIKFDVWVPHFEGRRETRTSIVIGRLRPGISIGRAQAEMDVIEARLARQYSEQKGYGARIQPLQTFMYGQHKSRLLAIFGAVILVMLMACLNVVNLLLARGSVREKEMAVRSSLGAGRPRMVRQMLTESLLLSCLGTGLGLLLAYTGVRFAMYVNPEAPIPRADEISIDVHVLGFAVLAAVLTALLFGLFPALCASKPDLAESLKEGGRGPAVSQGGRNVQKMLVIGQIAISLPLLVGAGLMIHNVWLLSHKNFGFRSDHLAQISIRLPESEYMERVGKESTARLKPTTALAIRGIGERLRALPGVRAVGVTGSGVFYGCDNRPMSTEGLPPRQDYAEGPCYEPVTPGYFGMLEIPVMRGRVFTDWDSASSPPVAVISQSVAQRFFPGQDPIGKMITIGNWDSNDFERRQVVGVVADIQWSLTYPLHFGVYYPYSQMPSQFTFQQLAATFLVLSGTDPAPLVKAMDRAVSEVVRGAVITAAETVDNARRSTTDRTRFSTWMLAVFAGTALALAAVGVFGVMSYGVARRTHEIGIRMALGAHPGDILRLVLLAGAQITAIGITFGLACALGVVRILQSRLSDFEVYEVKPIDPISLVAVGLLLAFVALLACYIPARRAARMNPITSLRYE